MKADNEGRPGRSAARSSEARARGLLIDRIFHGLLGGVGSEAAGAARTSARLAQKAERIAERSVPAIRAELVNVEKPLVKEALEAGGARPARAGAQGGGVHA